MVEPIRQSTPTSKREFTQPQAQPQQKQQPLVKGLFQQTSLDVWQVYKQSLRAIEASFLQGKEEAFNEVIKYLVMLNTNSDFRYVPIKEFISYIESRYNAHREECVARNQKLASTNSQPGSVSSHLSHAASQVQAAVDSLEKQARTYADEQGPLSQVESKLARLNFEIFKVKGSKKRRHPTDNHFMAGSPLTSSIHSTHQNRVHQSYPQNLSMGAGSASGDHQPLQPESKRPRPSEEGSRSLFQEQRQHHLGEQPSPAQVGRNLEQQQRFAEALNRATQQTMPAMTQTARVKDQLPAPSKIDFSAFLPKKK